jgi:hypothetical protein
MMYCFETRTGRVCIDHEKCEGCRTLACVKACSLYGSGILRAQAGKLVLSIPLEETRRRGTECLACEIECYFHGQQAITISLPMVGPEENGRSKHGHPAE